jgi:capsular polysaccharide biosynthesis protein
VNLVQQRPWECPRWAIDWLRDRYGAPSADDAPRRVYLARGVGVRRRVVNEAELVAHLERRGFVTVSTIGRTIREQAALVGSAECIVAPLGAALGNLIFAPRTAQVIELAGKNFTRDTYRSVAATLGMPFMRIVGVEPGLPHRLGRLDEIDADTIVDVFALDCALDALAVR